MLNKLNYEFILEDTYTKMDSIMEEYKNKNICISYSGGSDSDTLMFLFKNKGYNIKGLFFNTGIEYNATLEHIQYMRSLGFTIDIIKAARSVPNGTKKFGLPFINKRVSEMLERMQKHNFDFKNDGNKTYEELTNKYLKLVSALKWWCNFYDNGSILNIAYNKKLKEFLIEFGLPFRVSGKCCDGAKKDPAKIYAKENKIDLMILGIRKTEGGVRASAYDRCYISAKSKSYSMYFPMFWWNNEIKKKYDEDNNIIHSKCYTEYGLERTGCAGCPFGRSFENELNIINTYEKKLYKGINNIFNYSYEWTKKYNFYKNGILTCVENAKKFI